MANRGQARPQDAPALGIDQLGELFNRLQQRPRDRFHAPKYNGTGDVELFIQQFNDITNANGWDNASSLLHLRTSLEQSAADCGRGMTIAEVQANLRARFGMTARQAKDRFANIKRESGQSLHTLKTEISRLAALAFPQMAQADRVMLSVEAFKRAVDNKALNRHLLAVPAGTMDEIVQAAEDFFQVGGFHTAPTNRHGIAAVGREDSGSESTTEDPMKTLLEQLVKSVQQNSELLGKLAEESTKRQSFFSSANNRKSSPNQSTDSSSKSKGCFNCGDTTHFKRQCPKLSGNDNSSQ